MANREQLQATLEEILGSRNVYFEPPESIRMNYDAIRYSIRNIKTNYADNSPYFNKKCYEITLISREPDNPIVDKLLQLPYCSFDRHYNADNLAHDVFTLYY